MTDPSLIVLKECRSSFEAHVVRDFLQSQGIETFIFDEFTHNMALGSQSLYIRLMVGADDFDAAQKLLNLQEKEQRQ
jgi:hypothetical protein